MLWKIKGAYMMEMCIFLVVKLIEILAVVFICWLCASVLIFGIVALAIFVPAFIRTIKKELRRKK